MLLLYPLEFSSSRLRPKIVIALRTLSPSSKLLYANLYDIKSQAIIQEIVYPHRVKKNPIKNLRLYHLSRVPHHHQN